MATTNFVDRSTLIQASWLNDVDATTYDNVVNVRHYGAVGDGTTDDSAAFTSAFAAIRTAVNGNTGASFTVLIPPGNYKISTSVNATDINPGNNAGKIEVRGYGARILGYCTGKPVFDAIASAQITWKGLYVEGNSINIPLCAFQIGRYADGVSASNNSFEDVRTFGSFSRTALYNLASEQCRYSHCQFNMEGSGTGQYAAIFDGMNYYNATSDYKTISIAQYDSQSFLNNTVYSTTFRGGLSGDTGGGLLLIAVNSFSAYDSYCVGRGGMPGTTIGVYNNVDSSSLILDIHSETEDNSDLSHGVYFKDLGGGTTSCVVDGFNFHEHQSHATTAIIGSNLSGNVFLQNAEIAISSVRVDQKYKPLFDHERYIVSGHINWGRTDAMVGTSILFLTGTLSTPYVTGFSDTVTFNASTDEATYAGTDQWTEGEAVQFTTTGTIASPLAVGGATYFVKNLNTTTNTFQIAATPGGTAINLSDVGTGTHTAYGGVRLPQDGAYVVENRSTRKATYYYDHEWATNLWSTGPLMGYTTGAGGTVTQATSKSTAVTLDKATGQITTDAASLASNTTVSFTLNNSLISSADHVTVHRKSGGTAGAYQVWVDSVSSGSAVICIRNTTGGALAEALVLSFAVLNGVTS